MFDLDVAPLLSNLLSSKGSLCVSPSRIGPPLLDLLDLLLVSLLLLVQIGRHAWECLNDFVEYRSNKLFETVRQGD